MPGTENPNLPTYGLSEAAVEERQPEVPNASFEGGGNEAASNSPGIGINTGDYDPKPSDWSREERTPQQFGHIGLTPLGDVRVDNPNPGELAYFVQSGGVAAPDAQIPGTGAFNRTGITVPSGAWLWGSSPGFAPESLALFAAMTPEPNEAQKLAINNFIVEILPFWDKFDWLGVMHSFSSQPSLVNWKNPLQAATPVNSPVFHEYSGWEGDGISAYLSVPVELSAYTLNDAHHASEQVSASLAAGSNPRLGDSRSARAAGYFPRNISDSRLIYINGGGGSTPAPIDDTLMNCVVRTSATSVSIYDGGELASTIANNSSVLAVPPFTPLRAIIAAGVTSYGDMRVNLVSIGSGLTSGEVDIYNNAWVSYKAAMAAS